MSEEAEVMEVQEEQVEESGGNVIDSLKEVLKKALIYDGLRRGIHECVKALDSGKARLCILSSNCENKEYMKLIQALCNETGVHLIMADSGKEIGEWVGLAKFAKDGTLKKAVRCSVAVVTDFGEESPALNTVLNYVKSKKA